MPSSNAMYKSLRSKKLNCMPVSSDTTGVLCPPLTFTSCMKHVFNRRNSVSNRGKNYNKILNKRKDNKESTYYRFVNIDVPPFIFNKSPIDKNSVINNIDNNQIKSYKNEIINQKFKNKFNDHFDENLKRFSESRKLTKHRMSGYTLLEGKSDNNYGSIRRRKKKYGKSNVGLNSSSKGHVLNSSIRKKVRKITKFKCGAETLSHGENGFTSAHSRLDSYYYNWVYMDQMQSLCKSHAIHTKSNNNKYNNTPIETSQQLFKCYHKNQKQNINNSNYSKRCSRRLSRTSSFIFKV
jgi:hypothetical protein